MANIIPIDQARALAPAKMRERFQAGTTVNKNFAEGVRDTFPSLSIKGKVFRMRQGGKEIPYVDPTTNQVMTFLDVVFVNASRLLAKSYYKKGFNEGDMDPPNCWSLDSIRPDPSVAEKQSPICASCPMNAFGSRITDSGKSAKACQDQRRIAVTLPHLLGQDVPTTVLLRVPQSSLKPMKEYVDMLARHQFEPTGCISRLSFDYNEAFPKLNFQFVKGLNDEEYDKVEATGASDYVQQMLNVPEDTARSQPVPAGGLQELEAGPAPLLQQDETPPEDYTPLPDDVGQQESVAPAVQQAVKDMAIENLIALPDGKFYNPLTQQYVEAPVAKPAQVKNPDVVALPDGKFFHTKLGQYVDSDMMDAPAAKEPAKAKPKAKAAPKPKAEPEVQQGVQQELLPPVNDKPAPAQETAKPKQEAAKPVQKASTNGGTIGVAPPDLDDILKGLVPPA
jgi:hypothetical protein